MGRGRASSKHSVREPRFLSELSVHLANEGIWMISTSDPAKSDFLVDLVPPRRPSGTVMIEKVPRGWQGSPGSGTPMA